LEIEETKTEIKKSIKHTKLHRRKTLKGNTLIISERKKARKKETKTNIKEWEIQRKGKIH
jgi:hypothetical protein